MAEMAGKWMEDHKVKFIKKHVPTKVRYYIIIVHIHVQGKVAGGTPLVYEALTKG